MKQIIQTIEKIDASGYKAYVVGGYVRNTLLHKTSFDVDIATNANIEILRDIFLDTEYHEEFNCISFTKGQYHFEITPFREESTYIKNRYPKEIKHTNDIKIDSKRRDFTINAIYMDKNKEYICLHDGLNDIKNKIIRTIGDPKTRLEEDALRILRAIRFSVTLDFKLEENLSREIKNCGYLLKELSYMRKKQELDQIYQANSKRGLELIYKHNLAPYLDIPDNIVPTDNIYGIWSQMNYKKYPFTKEELAKIEEIHTLVQEPFTKEKLVFSSLEFIETASIIKNIDYKKIEEEYNSYQVHSMEEMKIDIEYLKQAKLPISTIKKDVFYKILYNQMENKEDIIREYITKNYNK